MTLVYQVDGIVSHDTVPDTQDQIVLYRGQRSRMGHQRGNYDTWQLVRRLRDI